VVALKITALLYLIVFTSLATLIARDVVLRWLGIETPAVIAVIMNLRWLVIVLLFFFCISFIYRHAPSVQKKWRLINPGSIVATLLMLLMTLALSWWVSQFSRYNQLYGSIGTVLIIMIMIFINSLILLIGFELNVSIHSLHTQAKEKEAIGLDE
jgi:membrane protein